MLLLAPGVPEEVGTSGPLRFGSSSNRGGRGPVETIIVRLELFSWVLLRVVLQVARVLNGFGRVWLLGLFGDFGSLVDGLLVN